MKLSKIFLLSSVALMAVACQDKKDEPIPTPTPTPGEDVCFGGELEENAESRTIYGTETPGANGAYSFPIKWLWYADDKDNDKVFIASPQCRADFNSGTFAVTEEANNKTYAGTFVKQSGAVQWGSTATADFYSIYPQRDGNFEVKTASGFSDTNATFELNMPATQTCIVEGSTPVMTTADMWACFMYAKTPDVANGTTPVNLRYTPLSTAIRFTLRGPNVQGQNVEVSRIRLIGPSDAALTGKFNVNLTNVNQIESEGHPIIKPTVTPVSGETSNIVTVFARYKNEAYLQLSYGQSIELNAFVIPVNGLSIDANWKLEVTLASGKQVIKTLTPKQGTNTNLVAGLIHRLGEMPYLPQVEIDITKWMTFMPRNVYLSEISIPGSWNSLNSDFQTTTDGAVETINRQYAKGCRAFHIDTRWNSNQSRGTWPDVYTQPSDVKDANTLAIADGGTNRQVQRRWGGTDYGRVMLNGTAFKTAFEQIAYKVQDDEYMVIFVTFAQDSYVRDVDFTSDRGIEDHVTYMQGVEDAISSSSYSSKVFNGANLSSTTTINDVLGKVIVIVNCTADPSTLTLPNNSKCVYTYMPMERSSSVYPGTIETNTTSIFKSSKTATGISLVNTQAQVTWWGTGGSSSEPSTGNDTNDRGYAPALAQRITVGNNILNESKRLFTGENYAHSTWYFNGLGGYLVRNKRCNPTNQSGVPAYQTVTSKLNAWIDGRLTTMDNEKLYYPVGIILLNQVEQSSTSAPTFNTPETIKNIIFLNNKFHKEFDPSKPEWPDNTTLQNVTGGNMSDGGNGI